MSLPTLQKSWLFSTNNRISFVSLNDTMARFLFGIKNFLVATVGYTVKYSCDGVTGPTSSVDNTDRWISFSNCTTRGTTTTSPQSFVVLTDSSTAVFATGVLTTTANFANGETVTTDTKVYTFQTVLTNVDGNVLIGGSAAASLANIAAAINLGAGSGTAYAAATTANTFVSATSAPTTLTLTALVAGPAANTTATTETAANASFASATLTGGSGVDILLTYQGAADHLCKMSISVGALFTPAGTPTNQPTATDELVNFPNTGIAASTVIDSTASGDRVFHLMATTDKRGFRCFIYRQNVMISWIAVEVITSTVTAMSWPSKVLVWATNVSIGSSPTNGHVLISSTTVGNGNGGGVRIGGTNIRADGGGFSIGGANNFLTQLTPTDMEAAPALGPLGLYSAIAAFQGKLGDRIDMYVPWANVVQGNVFGNSQWVYMGTAIHPWNSGPVILS